MTISYSNFFAPTVLTTSAATLFTAPTLPSTTLLRGGRIRFTNTSGGAVTVTAHAVPAAGSASDTNCFCKAVSIAAAGYLDVDVPIMPAASFLQALASANTSVSAHMLSGAYFS